MTEAIGSLAALELGVPLWKTRLDGCDDGQFTVYRIVGPSLRELGGAVMMKQPRLSRRLGDVEVM